MTTSLVIGSDEGVLEGIAQALATAGHRAHVVRSMAEAAAVLTEIHPLVILVDRSCAALGHAEDVRAVRENYASLTRREREVMVLVAAGLLNKQVAHELGISQITVKAYRGSMMRKMNADSLAALVRMADSLRITASQWNWRSSRLTWSAFGARRNL